MALCVCVCVWRQVEMADRGPTRHRLVLWSLLLLLLRLPAAIRAALPQTSNYAEHGLDVEYQGNGIPQVRFISFRFLFSLSSSPCPRRSSIARPRWTSLVFTRLSIAQELAPLDGIASLRMGFDSTLMDLDKCNQVLRGFTVRSRRD